MMIYVNGRFLLQSLTGVNRFAYELCRAWVAMGIRFTVCCPPGQIKECYDTSGFSVVRFGWGRSHIWEQLSLPFWFHRIKGEKVLVCLTGLAPLFTREKLMTIHDLAFMVNPGWYTFPYRIWYRLMTPLCAATSRKILTVSEFSKSEITQRLSVKPHKISVIYNAVAPFFQVSDETGNEGHGQPSGERYILAVSSIDPRKNFTTLLKAFARVKDKTIKLYIIGGQAAVFSTSVAKLNQGTCANRIKWIGRVTDAELKQYYAHACCFVYPSVYEGFGIPPLEAMACGTPTVVSTIPPLKEVCQDASLYVDPYDEQDIADKISALLRDEALSESLKEKGRKRCLEFDWQESAAKLEQEIRSCVPVNKC